jgi:RNA 3'-phosphate cyclase
MLQIDGSYLEGGGQILRTSLAFSALTGQAFTITGIRAGRKNPGLQAQHLNAVRAAQRIWDAKVSGDKIGSRELSFRPGSLHGQDITIDIGTAGSITLLLQAMLPPLMFADKESRIRIIGGTDVKWSQPFDYFKNVLVPYLNKFAEVEVELVRRGYFPKGGGEVRLGIAPKYHVSDDFTAFRSGLRNTLPEMNLTERGQLVSIEGVSHAASSLKSHDVAGRQAEAATKALDGEAKIEMRYSESACPGSGITLWARFEGSEWPVVLGADALGERGKRAEAVGKEAAESLKKQLDSGAPVDSYLADQLLPFVLFLPGASYRISQTTNHCKTNIAVIQKFVDAGISEEENVITLTS